MTEEKSQNPVGLLIDYHDKKSLPPSERKAVRDALKKAGCTPKFLSDDTVKKLSLLRKHRNQVQHPEDHPPYDQTCLEELLREVWGNNWIVGFLGKLHANS